MSATPTPSETAVATPPTRDREWAKSTADTIITTIREGDPRVPEDNGHQFCASCHARLKEVEPPKPDSAFFDRYYGDSAPKWVGGGLLDLGTVKELVHGEESEVAGTITVSGELDMTEFTEYRHADSPVSSRASIGRAHPTENATHGISDENTLDSNPWRDIPRQGLVCTCGVSNHRYVERPISTEQAVDYAENLSESINSIREEIEHEVSVKGTYNVPEWRVARIEEWRHSTAVLTSTVEKLKNRRDMQGKKPIFKGSLAAALRRPDY